MKVEKNLKCQPKSLQDILDFVATAQAQGFDLAAIPIIRGGRSHRDETEDLGVIMLRDEVETERMRTDDGLPA